MGRRKIVDEGEVRRWYEVEARTLEWMVSAYRDQYGVETTTSMFNNLAARRGWTKRVVRSIDLVPWDVAPKHRWQYPVKMLRFEARARAGRDLRPPERADLDRFLARVQRDDVVVAYNAERGFHYLQREVGEDLIRQPVTGFTRRRPTDR